MKQLLRFGSALVVSSAAEIIVLHAEKLLLPRYASVSALAYYSVAFTLAYMLTQLPAATLQSLIPALSRLHGSDDTDGFSSLYRRAWLGMLYWILPGASFITIVALPFFTYWAGPQFGRESTIPLYLLVGGVMLEIMSFVPYAVLIAFGRADLVARCHVVLIAPYVVTSAVLIAHYGAAGAAVAWTLRAFADTALFLYFTRRISNLPVVVRPANVGVFMVAIGVLALGTAAGLSTAGPIARTSIATLSVAIYAVVMVTRVFTGEERVALRRLLRFGRMV